MSTQASYRISRYTRGSIQPWAEVEHPKMHVRVLNDGAQATYSRLIKAGFRPTEILWMHFEIGVPSQLRSRSKTRKVEQQQALQGIYFDHRNRPSLVCFMDGETGWLYPANRTDVGWFTSHAAFEVGSYLVENKLA